MTGNQQEDVILQLDGVKKVFETDEVETHALLDIHLEIRRGDYICISGPPARARPRSCPFSGCSTRRARGRTSWTASRSPT